jgi:hypothetical protein
MLAWGEIPLLDRALIAKAARSLQKELHALAPAEPADRANISCQTNLLQPSLPKLAA